MTCNNLAIFVISCNPTDLWTVCSTGLYICRCYDSMKNYIDESVLSKLPTGYQSNLKESNASEEDDMGN